MKEGWLIDRDSRWVYRFHRDEKSWVRDPHVFIDHGRGMPDGEPALLKSRRHVRTEDARLMWKELIRSGWHPTGPIWGSAAEP